MQQAAYLVWRNPRVQLLTHYLWRDEPVGGGKSLHRLAVGPLLLRRRPQAVARALRRPVLGRLRAQHPVGPGAPGRHAPGPGRGPRAGHRHVVAGAAGRHDRRRRHVVDQDAARPVRGLPRAQRHRRGDRRRSWRRRCSPTSRTSRRASRRRWCRAGRSRRRPPRRSRRRSPGLSIEYHSVGDYIGSYGKLNPIFLNLMKTLSRAGNGRADAALRRRLDRPDVVEPGRAAEARGRPDRRQPGLDPAPQPVAAVRQDAAGARPEPRARDGGERGGLRGRGAGRPAARLVRRRSSSATSPTSTRRPSATRWAARLVERTQKRPAAYGTRCTAARSTSYVARDPRRRRRTCRLAGGGFRVRRTGTTCGRPAVARRGHRAGGRRALLRAADVRPERAAREPARVHADAARRTRRYTPI